MRVCPKCDRPTSRFSRGVCQMCYRRHQRAGRLDELPKAHRTAAEHWDSLDKTQPGCWTLDLSTKGGGGYTYVHYRGKLRRAHRLYYELQKGAPVEPGLVLDHLCRNRACVRPDHLEEVSHIENVRRGLAMTVNGQRQAAKTHCPQGHEYTADNLRPRPNGWRSCLTCHRQRELARGRRKAAQRNPLNSPHSRSQFKTHCVHGHEYTPENTFRDRKGHRKCRTCKRLFHNR